MEYTQFILIVYIGIFIIHTFSPYPDHFTIYPNIDLVIKKK